MGQNEPSGENQKATGSDFMGHNLTLEELERRWAEVDARPAEEPTADDLAALAEADAEDPAEAITLEEYKAKHRYEFDSVPAEQVIEDAKQVLEDFTSDYERMAK